MCETFKAASLAPGPIQPHLSLSSYDLLWVRRVWRAELPLALTGTFNGNQSFGLFPMSFKKNCESGRRTKAREECCHAFGCWHQAHNFLIALIVPLIVATHLIPSSSSPENFPQFLHAVAPDTFDSQASLPSLHQTAEPVTWMGTTPTGSLVLPRDQGYLPPQTSYGFYDVLLDDLLVLEEGSSTQKNLQLSSSSSSNLDRHQAHDGNSCQYIRTEPSAYDPSASALWPQTSWEITNADFEELIELDKQLKELDNQLAASSNPSLHPALGNVQDPKSLFSCFHPEKNNMKSYNVWLTNGDEWQDLESGKNLQQRAIRIPEKCTPGRQKPAQHIDWGLGHLPCPIWPSLSALAISSDHVVSLRPFKFWNFNSRAKQINQKFLSPRLELEITQVHAELQSKKSLIPPYPADKDTLIFCPAFPISYAFYGLNAPRGAFIKWQRPDSKSFFYQAEARIEWLFKMATFFHGISWEIFQKSISTQALSGVSSPEVQSTTSFLKEREHFLAWLREQIFEESNSLPVVGWVKSNIKNLDVNHFTFPKKLFLFVITTPRFEEYIDPVGLSLLALWYKSQNSGIWSEYFSTEDNFWNLIRDHLLSDKNYEPFEINHWW
ncbi:hypothetical protein O181_046534 [Austropuccinia psidii MF-1]|uniref:Uncharacterized protein n=1 Tax=Austropuccinia psidii MF-1 TaxID=1389203 RepID=A0A9Q3DPA2_9BASI|nr:hypothetical protein [Austropuccinia psidii MF-1]